MYFIFLKLLSGLKYEDILFELKLFVEKLIGILII